MPPLTIPKGSAPEEGGKAADAEAEGGKAADAELEAPKGSALAPKGLALEAPPNGSEEGGKAADGSSAGAGVGAPKVEEGGKAADAPKGSAEVSPIRSAEACRAGAPPRGREPPEAEAPASVPSLTAGCCVAAASRILMENLRWGLG